MRRYRLVYVDGFTDRPLAGNQLAVVLDADASREMNLVETTSCCRTTSGRNVVGRVVWSSALHGMTAIGLTRPGREGDQQFDAKCAKGRAAPKPALAGAEGRVAFTVRRVDYFNSTVADRRGTAFKLLSQLADVGVDLIAFTAVPVGPMHAQITLFPKDTPKLVSEARKAGLAMDGPHPALLVQGDDELGALARIHQRIFDAGVNVYASSGVADGKGSFGYVVYVKADDYERAAQALGV